MIVWTFRVGKGGDTDRHQQKGLKDVGDFIGNFMPNFSPRPNFSDTFFGLDMFPLGKLVSACTGLSAEVACMRTFIL